MRKKGAKVEIWSVNERGKISCHHLFCDWREVEEKIIELDKKYPGRTFLVSPALYLRRVENGEVIVDTF